MYNYNIFILLIMQLTVPGTMESAVFEADLRRSRICAPDNDELAHFTELQLVINCLHNYTLAGERMAAGTASREELASLATANAYIHDRDIWRFPGVLLRTFDTTKALAPHMPQGKVNIMGAGQLTNDLLPLMDWAHVTKEDYEIPGPGEVSAFDGDGYHYESIRKGRLPYTAAIAGRNPGWISYKAVQNRDLIEQPPTTQPADLKTDFHIEPSGLARPEKIYKVNSPPEFDFQNDREALRNSLLNYFKLTGLLTKPDGRAFVTAGTGPIAFTSSSRNRQIFINTLAELTDKFGLLQYFGNSPALYNLIDPRPLLEDSEVKDLYGNIPELKAILSRTSLENARTFHSFGDLTPTWQFNFFINCLPFADLEQMVWQTEPGGVNKMEEQLQKERIYSIP